MKEVFVTNVGSHMWGMNHPGSDVDLFVAYAVPSSDILRGIAKTDSQHVQRETVVGGVPVKEDLAIHEIGKVVDMVLDGNVNFLWGVFSPLVVRDTEGYLRGLKDIALRNLSQRCYGSIHGLGIHNYKKYIESGKDPSEKRCNIIARTAQFGINLLLRGVPEFRGIIGTKPEQIPEFLRLLDEAKAHSILPENAQYASEMRDWLLKTRNSYFED